VPVPAGPQAHKPLAAPKATRVHGKSEVCTRRRAASTK